MSDHSDILQVEGINSKGFGILPKLVMQDRRLSCTAKAIYGYFCSFAGAGKQAFPRVTRIMADLGLCKTAYYRHFNQLRDFGYIKAQQERRNGKLTHNIYTLMQTVQGADIPCPKKQDTAALSSDDLRPIKQPPIKQPPIKQDTRNNNNLKNKQSLKINSQSCPQSEDRQGVADAKEVEMCIEGIKYRMHYEDVRIAHENDTGLVDEIVSVIADALLSDSATMRIDGEDKPRALVQHALKEIGYWDVDLVIERFGACTERISKKRRYLLSMLYNARHEREAHYMNEVNANWGN